MTFSEKLRELRTAAGLSQSQLAAEAGVSLDTLQDYEQGTRRGDPKLRLAVKLAQAMGVSVAIFEGCFMDKKAKRGK